MFRKIILWSCAESETITMHFNYLTWLISILLLSIMIHIKVQWQLPTSDSMSHAYCTELSLPRQQYWSAWYPEPCHCCNGWVQRNYLTAIARLDWEYLVPYHGFSWIFRNIENLQCQTPSQDIEQIQRCCRCSKTIFENHCCCLSRVKRLFPMSKHLRWQ